MTDDGRSRRESVVWALVLLVGPVGLVWEFGLSILHTVPLSQSYPIRFIEEIEVAMFALVILLGGGTLLVFIYAATRYSDGVVRSPEAMPVKWRQRSFVAWLALVVGVLLVTATVGASTLMVVDSGAPPTSSQGNRLDTAGSLTYKVIGVQWTWMMKPVSPNHLGFAMRRVMRVPANTTIRLKITSKDVIHSFAIQHFGVKKDAVPGQMNNYWFVAREPGRYQINCAELCGAGHSQMTPTLVVMPREEYAEWVVEHGGNNPFESIEVAQNGTAPGNDATASNDTATGDGTGGSASSAVRSGDADHPAATERRVQHAR